MNKTIFYKVILVPILLSMPLLSKQSRETRVQQHRNILTTLLIVSHQDSIQASNRPKMSYHGWTRYQKGREYDAQRDMYGPLLKS